MPDPIDSTGPHDRTRINVQQDFDVRDWADKFGVTPDDVRDAVKAVGDQAEAVQEYLHAHHWSPGK